MTIIGKSFTYQRGGRDMTENCRTVAVIKGQLAKFSGIIAKGFSKPKQKFIKEMLYGIQSIQGYQTLLYIPFIK